MRYQTAKEFARSHNLPMRFVSLMCRLRKLPYIPRGKGYLINVEAAEDALQNMELVGSIDAEEQPKEPRQKSVMKIDDYRAELKALARQ